MEILIYSGLVEDWWDDVASISLCIICFSVSSKCFSLHWGGKADTLGDGMCAHTGTEDAVHDRREESLFRWTGSGFDTIFLV